MVISSRSVSFVNYVPAGPAIGARRGPTRRPRAGNITRGSSSGTPSPSEDAPEGAHPGRSAPWVSPAIGIAARNWPLFLRTFLVYATQVVYRVFSQPFQPAVDRLQARAAQSDAIRRACERLQVDDLHGLQDLCNSLVLAESVYKVVGRPEGEAARFMSALKAAFPPGIVTICGIQFARPHVRHRFVIAEAGDALYVAFMGTKLAKDFLTNAAVWQEEVRLDTTLLATDEAEGLSGAAAVPGAQSPAAHRGFLNRARAIPIDALYEEACRRGKRLVLCGHSLGGAVAQLCTIKLLQRLPPSQHHTVACFGFATPALGNHALVSMVEEKGWDGRIRNYLVPEDPIPHLLSSRRTSPVAGATSAADQMDRQGETRDGFSGLPPGPRTIAQAAASNITAMPGRVMRFVGRPVEDKDNHGQGDKEASTAVFTLAREKASDATEQEPPGDKGEASSGGRQPFRAALGVARAPFRVAIGAAQFAAAVPMRAAPRYLPLGKQLFVTDDVTSEWPTGSLHPPRRLTRAESAVLDAEPSSKNAASVAVNKTTITQFSWFPWSRSPRSLGHSAAHSSLDGDDDNVDIAAASIAAGGLVPARLPARTLFPMHRMLTYRSRLLSICQEALSGHKWPTLLPNLPYLGSIPSPHDVVSTELLAPAMFPLRAQASILQSTSTTTKSSLEEDVGEERPVQLSESHPASANRILAWPLRLLLRRPLPAADTTEPVEVLVRIDGKGLNNVTAAWISGACIDENGRATPSTMDILHRPDTSIPSTMVGTIGPAPSPRAFASWLALAVGWVEALRRLQPAGRGDYLLARAKLPVGAVLEAQRAGKDPLLVATIGTVPRLMVHVQSDFALHSLPLNMCSSAETKSNRAERMRGGFKDPSTFLRHARLGLACALGMQKMQIP